MFLIKDLESAAYYVDCEHTYANENTRLLEYLNVGNDHAPAWVGGEMYANKEYSAEMCLKVIDGVDPISGDKLVKNAEKADRNPGRDICFTLPKGASIAYALMPAEDRKLFDAAQKRAVEQCMNKVVKQLTKPSNFDAQQEFTNVELVYFGFNHYENRDQEPHLHTHLLLPNVAKFTFKDGSVKTMAVNTAELMTQQQFITAYYLSTLEQELRKEPLGLRIDGTTHKNKFSVVGISQDQEDKLSARTTAIRQAVWGILAAKGAVFSSEIDQNEQIDAAIESSPELKEKVRDATKEVKTIGSYAEALGVIRNNARAVVDPQALALAQLAHKAKEAPEIKPMELLAELTNNEALFTEWQLKMRILQTQRGQVLPTDIDTYLAQQINACKAAGLVQLEPGLYTTQEIIKAEMHVEQTSKNLAPNSGALAEKQTSIDLALKYEFGKLDAKQKAACDVVIKKQLAIITGDAGSGKTSSVIKYATRATQSQGGKVWGTATQGNTAKALAEAGIAPENCLNTKAIITAYNNGKITFNKGDRLIVDEAGMVGIEDMAAIMRMAQKHELDLTLVGDSKQLVAVSAGKPFTHLEQTMPKQNQARLLKNYRAKTKEALAVAEAFRDKDPATGLALLQSQGNLHLASDKKDALAQAVDQYFAIKDDSKVLITYTNADVNRLNDLIRNRLIKDGVVHADKENTNQIGVDVVSNKSAKQLERRYFAPGDKIIFTAITKLDKKTVLQNGTQAKVIAINSRQMSIQTEGGEIHNVDLKKHHDFNHAYCITSNKSQGATFNHSIVLTAAKTTSNQAYVEMSRARVASKLVMLDGHQDTFIKSATKAQQKTSVLDYAAAKTIAYQIQRAELDVNPPTLSICQPLQVEPPKPVKIAEKPDFRIDKSQKEQAADLVKTKSVWEWQDFYDLSIQNGYVLAYADKEYKSDKDIVLAAVSQNGLALEYAATRLRNDPEVVLAAIKQNPKAIAKASPEVWGLLNNKNARDLDSQIKALETEVCRRISAQIEAPKPVKQKTNNTLNNEYTISR